MSTNTENELRTIILPRAEWSRLAREFARVEPRCKRRDEALRCCIVEVLTERIAALPDDETIAIERPESSWHKLVNAAARWGVDAWCVAGQLQEPPEPRKEKTICPQAVLAAATYLTQDDDHWQHPSPTSVRQFDFA